MASATPIPAPVRIVIRPRQTWLQFDWRGLIQYRDLLFLLVRRDFVSRYQQTVLGPAWFIINPLITTFVYVIFGRVVGISTNGIHPTLFYLSGLFGWTYFSQIVGGAGNSLHGNVGLFGKVYFPRLVVPLGVILSNLIALGIQFLTFVAVFTYLVLTDPSVTSRPNETLWALPLVVLQTAVLGLGVSLVFSSLSAKYRDLQQLTPFLMGIWMYGTPIMYPLSKVPEKWRWFWLLNPMTCITEDFRAMLLGGIPMTAAQSVLSASISVVLCVLGVLMFQRTARDFVDYA